jgi:hypothetical protein
MTIRILFVTLFALVCSGALHSEPLTRDAKTILEKMIVQADSSEAKKAEAEFSYSRQTLVFFFDEHGKVTRKRDRLYEVVPVDGEPMMRLVKVNGKWVGPDKAERKNAYSQAGNNARKLEINEDLIIRYDFTFEGEEQFDGRPVFVLSFKPKAGTESDDGFFGKLLSQLAGKIWVDAEDHQLARLDVKLLQKVNFFGGIAGAIERMDLKLARQRVAPGMWLNRNSVIDLEARKLFSRMKMRVFENCSAFKPVTELAAKAAN